MSKTERLFEAESTLRMRAIQFADVNLHLQGISKGQARRDLRAAAIEYAAIAKEIDECFEDKP